MARWPAHTIARNAASILAVAAGYYVCAVIGTVLSVPPSGFAIIWPATAFLMSVLLVAPPRLWWIYLGAVLLAHLHLATIFQPAAPFVVVLTQISGNFALAIASVFAVQAVARRPILFDTFRSVLIFIVVAGIAVPSVVNALILLVHLATGWTNDFWQSWRQWMIAGVFPTITIPPLIVLAVKSGLTGRPPVSRNSNRELAVAALLLFGMAFFSFGAKVSPAHAAALLLTPTPVLLWAAVRLGVGGTSITLLALAAAIIAQALRHEGPFAAQSAIDEVISLQVFLVLISVPVILLAALMDERRRTERLFRQSEERMAVAAASTDTGLWQWDAASGQMWATDHCWSTFGLKAEPAIAPEAFLGAVHPEDRARVAELLKSTREKPDVVSLRDFRVVRQNAEVRWYILRTHTEFGRYNTLLRISGVFRDITQRVVAQREAEQLGQRLLTLQDEERRSIAEELHDSTAQHLVAVNLNLAALKARGSLPSESLGLIDETQNSVREATSEIRTFTYLLRPPQLEEEGLCTVSRQYILGFGRRTGLQTAIRLNPLANDLPSSDRRALLRIIQESLTNVHRHAAATHVSVNLRCIRESVHLVVQDNGRGMPSADGNGERVSLGVGLPGMAMRVRQLGGKFEVKSGSKGTTVHATIPFRRTNGEVATDDPPRAGGRHESTWP
jgi:PAS domain S-box-containing protein